MNLVAEMIKKIKLLKYIIGIGVFLWMVPAVLLVGLMTLIVFATCMNFLR